MNSFVLLGLLAAVAGISVLLATLNYKINQILNLLKRNDLSNEDAQVKAMTEQIDKAKKRLPPTKQEK